MDSSGVLGRRPWARVCALVASVGVILGTAPATASAGETAVTSSASTTPRCAPLVGTRIPARVISLATRGGTVQAAAQHTMVLNGRVVQYCQVDAALFPVDRSAPDILMRVDMPTGWNRRTLMFGGGGFDGTIPDLASADVPFGPINLIPLERGYATYGSDSGHQANPAYLPSPSLDGSFAMNDEALRNFTGDALKKTHDAAMFLLGKAYPVAPTYKYFVGGSSGGREALEVAQRWPTAFNGVVSVFPAWNNMAEILYLGHLARMLAQPGAFPGPAQQTLLYENVMAACDGLDGVKDRVISNVDGCHYDPHQLACPAGVPAGPSCLSDLQIKSVIAMSTPYTLPYRLESGEQSYPGFPFLSGADMRPPILGMGSSAPANPMPKDSGYGMQFWEQWVRYVLTRDPSHNSLALDPDQPGKWLQRINNLSLLEDVNNADLRPFAKAGGKLIMLHGSADELVSHWSTNDYYRRVQSTVGPARTAQFVKYYVVPGANHGNLDAAFSAAWDSIAAIQRWVENGQAPTNQIVTDANTGRTRPLCEFPGWPQYQAGNVDSASSFTCHR